MKHIKPFNEMKYPNTPEWNKFTEDPNNFHPNRFKKPEEKEYQKIAVDPKRQIFNAAHKAEYDKLDTLYNDGVRLTEEEYQKLVRWINTSDRISGVEEKDMIEFCTKFIEV